MATATPNASLALDRTVATTVFAATQFLYTGPDAVQTGLNPETIDPKRAAVLRGSVTTRAGSPLAGVTVAILDRPEFGSTLTQADGFFDMAVNGGGLLTVDYQKTGYLPVQRQLDVPWNDYALADDVVMIALDTQVTTVDLTESVDHVARGNVVTDADGTRQATVLLPAGTGAQLVMADGSTQALSTLHMRATEYTVGDNGPKAMPGPLPPTSAYTYAVELSADEAITAGAARVEFNQPVIFYVENFLDFPAGVAADTCSASPDSAGVVPVGFYDRERGVWVPSDNGRIIQIVGVTDGLAAVDTDGDGIADSGLGVTDAERAQLAALYQPGQSLWRVPITHFSAWDFNWPFGPPFDALPPAEQDFLRDLGLEDEYRCVFGSRIECENQVLGEAADLTGTPFQLHYQSDRVPGRRASSKLLIKLSGDSLPASVKRIELEVIVAGREFTSNFSASPNQATTFVWDGMDVYGRVLQGRQLATVRVGYVYDGVYKEGRGFGSSGATPITGSRTRREVTLWRVAHRAVGTFDARAVGLGGWTLSAHHVYEGGSRTIQLGTGERRSADRLPAVIRSVAVGEPVGVAVAPDGSIYMAEAWKVRRVAPDGTITPVAGTGAIVFSDSGDGGPATDATLSYAAEVAPAPDGSLYIAEWLGNRIRRVDLDGVITTVAGTGQAGYGGDCGPATMAQLNSPFGIAVAPDGTLYVADPGNNRVRRVGVDGIITTAAGVGVQCNGWGDPQCFGGDGGPAVDAPLNEPDRVAVGPDGDLYILDYGNHRIRRVGPDGIITTVAGNGTTSVDPRDGDGGFATAASIGYPLGIAVGRDGTLYIADEVGAVVRAVDPSGIITTIAGTGYIPSQPCGGNPNGLQCVNYGDGGPATAAPLSDPQDVAVGPDGGVYVVDFDLGRIRAVVPPLPGLQSDDSVIASEDGTQVYVFDNTGRHLRTLNALSGAVQYTFGYDPAGQLSVVTDGDGNVTAIQRDANGDPVAVVGPYGQRTTLALDDQGYLASISNPANEQRSFTYTVDGLMTSMTDPRGHTYMFSYDDDGLGWLTEDADPAGGSKTLARTDAADGYTVALSTALGRTTTHLVQRPNTGIEQRDITAPNGLQTVTQKRTDGSRTVTTPDGTVTTLRQGPDPRFGMEAAVPGSQTVAVPNGPTSTVMTARAVALSNPDDPLSLTSSTDTVTVNGHAFTTSFDAASHTFTSTSPEGRQTVSTVDAQGRPLSTQVTGILPVVRTYDTHGRLAAIAQGSGTAARVTTFAYRSSDGFLASLTDALGRVISFDDYDAAGRVKQQTLPGNRVILFDYDENGNLRSLTPPGRPAHAFTYTEVDLIHEYVPPIVPLVPTPSPTPMPLVTTYTYNLDRQLELVTRPDGAAIDYVYDTGTGRLSELLLPGNQSVSYAYDPDTGQVASVTAADGTGLTLAHAGNLLTSETWSGTIAGSVSRTYNSDLRVASQSINGGSAVTFTYDHDGLLTSAGSLTLVPDADNGLVRSTTLGVVSDAMTYTAFGELDTYEAVADSSTVYAAQYPDRDKLGRVTEKAEAVEGGLAVSTFYKYDDAGRLYRVCADASCTTIQSEYTYDANGNRAGGFTVTQGAILSTSYDDQDRLLSYETLLGGTTTYTYTANGELATRTDSSGTTTYTYDVLGNLRTVVLPSSDQIDYLVDGKNRRVGKKVNGTLVQGFVYDGQLRIVAELDGSGAVVSRFVYASKANVPEYMIRGGGTYRLVPDHLGSLRLVVNTADGTIAQRLDYDEFGNVTYDSAPGFQPLGFAGGLHDRDTKLVRFGARDYNPGTGRWTAKDPVGFGARAANLYGYALGDPVNKVDAAGLAPGDPYPSRDAAAIAAIAYILGASVANDREYGGIIYENRDGSWSYTTPVYGDAHSVRIPLSCPSGTSLGGGYHTHGDYTPPWRDDQFSPADENFPLPFYLGDVFGDVMLWDGAKMILVYGAR